MITNHLFRFRWARLAIVPCVVFGFIAGSTRPAEANHPKAKVKFTLTLLHNNDAESQLIDAGSDLEDFGGVARFTTVVRNLKREATRGGRGAKTKRGVIMVSSGDNFLAGPEFNASLEMGVPFFDSIAMDFIGYDAVAIGNHEFDFGPDILADFIEGFMKPVPFVSANLDFSGEPRLQDLVDSRRIVTSIVVRERGELVGIVGATTPNLPFISSPRNVVVDPDVAGIIQAEVDALEASGINKIILISHLQSIQEDLDLIPLLSGIDIAVAGGGDELLANPGDLLLPGDESEIFGPYPLRAVNADGDDVPVVTTTGEYRYVGRLVVGFDRHGRVMSIDDRSGPVRVSGVGPDAVSPNRPVQMMVADPVEASVAALASNVIALSDVPLDGLRSSVRTMETNEGNLIADALLFAADRLAADLGLNAPDVALQNGGGIRNNTIIPAGDITELDTFDMVPFPNFVSLFENIPPAQFKEILENAVSQVESVSGRFAQISGFTMVWDATGTPQELDADNNVVIPGTRVLEVVLDDGTPIVLGGVVVGGAPSINIATIDFLARGGDQYPFRDAPFTVLGVSYQQALLDFIETPVSDGGLDGLITSADYPEGGEGRNTRLN